MPVIQSAANQSVRTMGMSREFAELWADRANIGIIIAAVLGVVSTGLAIWTGNVKESYLKRDIANTNAVAEGEKLARLKLEKEMAWRSLPEENANMALAMELFTGQSFTILTYQDDPEAINLTNNLLNILVTSGWQFEKPKGFLAFNLEIGVRIETPPNKWEAFGQAARALSMALNDAGISASAGVREGLETDSPNTITIRVGKKPGRIAH